MAEDAAVCRAEVEKPAGALQRRAYGTGEQICGDVNPYWKLAFVEAGNLVVIHQKRLAGQHVARLYPRVRRKRNHQKAVVAVARHLAEAAYWVLRKQEVYREPQPQLKASAKEPAAALSSTHG